MNVLIVFVKILGWIVAISVILARIIEKKGDLKFWKEDHLKNKMSKSIRSSGAN